MILRWRTRTLYVLSGLLAALIVIAGSEAFGLAAGQKSASTAPSCPVPTSALLTPSDLPGFTRIVDVTYSSVPWKGGRPGSTPPPFAAAFGHGRMVGYLSNIALHGPDVPAERVRERHLGYKGRWPLVPLQGPVVRHNRGVLEVYETVLTFTSSSAAEGWLAVGRSSAGLESYSHAVPLPGGASDGFARAGTMGPNTGANEHFVVYTDRVGSRVITVRFQGGRGVDPTNIRRLWEAAWGRFLPSCGAALATK